MKAFGVAIAMAAVIGVAALVQVQTAPPAQAQAAAARPTLPPGPGLDLLNERCVSCHTASMITARGKEPAAWALTVQRMADRGAELSLEEMALLSEYLATALPPRPAGAATAPRTTPQGG